MVSEDLNRLDMKEIIAIIHRFKNMSIVRNTDHSNILKLNEMLQITKLSINTHTTTLWELDPESLYESDQSYSYETGYMVKFEDYPENHQSNKLIDLCNDIINDLSKYFKNPSF
jgi:hypothetical protein